MTEKKEHPESTPVPVAETTEEISDVISKLETHKVTVLVAIIGAAIVLSVVIVFRGVTSQKHLDGAEAYSQAAGSRKVAELDKVIADFPNSIAAGNALLTKAELQLTSGKSEDARIALLSFVEKFTSHPRHTQGLFAMGNLYQVAGDNENAAKYYGKVLTEDPKSDLAPFAMIRQGDLLLASGKTDEARQKYESIMPAYRGTKFFDRIEEKLKLLKVEKLAVVEAPKKPVIKPAVTPKITPKVTPKPAAKAMPKPAAKKAPAPKVKAAAKPAKPAPQKPKVNAAAKPAPKKAATKPAKDAAKTSTAPASKPSAKKADTPPAPKTDKKAPAEPKKEAAEKAKDDTPPAKAEKKPAPATPAN